MRTRPRWLGIGLFLAVAVGVVAVPTLVGPAHNAMALRANTDLVVNETLSIARRATAEEGGIEASITRWRATAAGLRKLSRRVPKLLRRLPREHVADLVEATTAGAVAFDRVAGCAARLDDADRFELKCEPVASVASGAAVDVVQATGVVGSYGWASLPDEVQSDRVNGIYNGMANWQLILRAPITRPSADDEWRYVTALRATIGRSIGGVDDEDETLAAGYTNCSRLGAPFSSSLAEEIGNIGDDHVHEQRLDYQLSVKHLCPQYAVRLAAINTTAAINFPDGAWTVGDSVGQVPPGTWTASYDWFGDRDGLCTWSRLGGDGSVIASGRSMEVTIEPTDARFVAENCGRWKHPPAHFISTGAYAL